MRHWYFAYGSNMQIDTFRGRRGIEYARALAGRAPGWRVVFDKPPLIPIGESFATLIADPTAVAFGVLYEIDPDALAHLQLTEGVPIGNYHAVEISVSPLGDAEETFRAVTLSSENRAADLQPSTRYMGLVIAGAIEHGLPDTYVEELRRVPARPPTALAQLTRPLVDQFLRRNG